MSSAIDYVPAAPSVAAPPSPVKPRGGRRPGAGAPKGNLNALTHGRHSRFRDLIGLEPDGVALAGRLLARERRSAERRAVTLLRLARVAAHRRELAAAIEQGVPLPAPPLVDLDDLDLAPLFRYMDRAKERDADERARRAGLLDPAGAAKARELAASLDSLVAVSAAALDAGLRALPDRRPAAAHPRAGGGDAEQSKGRSTGGGAAGFRRGSRGARARFGAGGSRKWGSIKQGAALTPRQTPPWPSARPSPARRGAARIGECWAFR